MNIQSSKYWIIVANASKLKIFASDTDLRRVDQDLAFVQELDHAASRLRDHDLESDRAGRYKTHESGGSAYQPAMDAQDVEKMHFAEEVALLLKNAKNSNKYDQLVLIMSGHFYGILKPHLGHIVQDSIHKVISKDYTTLTTDDLAKMIIKEVSIV